MMLEPKPLRMMKMMVMMMMMTVMIAAGAGSSKALKGHLKALKELFEGTRMALRRHSKDSSKTLRFSEGTQRVLRRTQDTGPQLETRGCHPLSNSAARKEIKCPPIIPM